MRTLTTLLVTLCLVSGAYADFTTISDFNTFTLGTVNGQGGWEVQANTSGIGDPGYVTVVTDATYGQVLNLQNRDTNGEIDTIYAALDLGVSLAGKETLKVTFRADGPNDTLMCTNDLLGGFDPDGDGQMGAPAQGGTDYTNQGAMVVLKSDDYFRARDGSSVNPSATGTNNYANADDIYATSGTWYDLYILVDSPNAKSLYAIVPAGTTATADDFVANPNGGYFWWHRNQTHANAAVENLKFMIGGYPWPDNNVETNVQIAEVAYEDCWSIPEPATMSLLALGGLALVRRRRA